MGDVNALESILNAWNQDVSSRVPEFWSTQVQESLAHLFGGISASLYLGGADLGEYRTRSRSLLVEIRDLLDQMMWADWPAMSSPVERDIRDLLSRVRELRRPAPPAPAPEPGSHD